MRIVFILLCFGFAVMAAYFGQPYVRDNSDVLTLMVTVITVFAGFLVALTAVLGDPSLIPRGSWRTAEARHGRLEAVLIRHSWLFYIYFAAIAFMFIGALVKKAPSTKAWLQIRDAIEFLYLFLASFSFFLTLAVPRTLGRIQMERSSAEIEQRRRDEGIKSNDP